MSWIQSRRVNEHLRSSRFPDQNKVLLSGVRSGTEWETESPYGLIHHFKNLVKLFSVTNLCLVSQSLLQMVTEIEHDWQILEIEDVTHTTAYLVYIGLAFLIITIYISKIWWLEGYNPSIFREPLIVLKSQQEAMPGKYLQTLDSVVIASEDRP